MNLVGKRKHRSGTIFPLTLAECKLLFTLAFDGARPHIQRL